MKADKPKAFKYRGDVLRAFQWIKAAVPGLADDIAIGWVRASTPECILAASPEQLRETNRFLGSKWTRV